VHRTSRNPAFRLNGAFSLKPFPRISGLLESTIERILALEQLEQMYQKLPPTRDLDHFLDQVASAFGIDCELATGDLERIPASGPTVVVANQ
jgi:hypothetical protein